MSTVLTEAEIGTRPIIVVDDVLADPYAYRARALAQTFGDVPAGDQMFQGIAPALDIRVADRIARDLLPGARVSLSFFRKSPQGQREPNYIHSDREMGDWTGILYLNPDPPAGDGTSFWRHRATGAVCGDFDADAAQDLSQWERWYHVDARFNRLLIFQSDYFHSRGLLDNFGEGDDARLIQVLFGRKPVPEGVTTIREATYADVPQIVEMGLEFLRTTAYRTRIAENPNQMAQVATFLLQGADRALFVAERDARLIGMIGLVRYPQPLSGELMAGEWFWWVTPEARGRVGLRLLDRAEEWAQASGATALQMIAPDADVERIYQRRGYEPIERSFQRRF